MVHIEAQADKQAIFALRFSGRSGLVQNASKLEHISSASTAVGSALHATAIYQLNSVIPPLYQVCYISKLQHLSLGRSKSCRSVEASVDACRGLGFGHGLPLSNAEMSPASARASIT